MLNRMQTVLVLKGRDLDFWRLINELCPDCYETIASVYEEAEGMIDGNGSIEGVDENGGPITVSELPTRPRPLTGGRPNFPS